MAIIPKIYSLEEYKPRFDKDVQKAYLSGRFGAVPRIKQLIESMDEGTTDAPAA